ncbi:hypothetical protein ACFWDQ_32900 [Streptomyces sp. NPDC060053]
MNLFGRLGSRQEATETVASPMRVGAAHVTGVGGSGSGSGSGSGLTS